MTPLQLIDERQAELCGDYARAGVAAFLIRTTEDGNCRIIGPQLNPESIARMLRTAAQVYLDQVPPVKTN